MSIASDDHLTEVARTIGKSQRDREFRYVLVVIVAFGIISLLILLFLSRLIINQTDAIEDSVNEAHRSSA